MEKPSPYEQGLVQYASATNQVTCGVRRQSKLKLLQLA